MSSLVRIGAELAVDPERVQFVMGLPEYGVQKTLSGVKIVLEGGSSPVVRTPPGVSYHDHLNAVIRAISTKTDIAEPYLTGGSRDVG